MAEGRLIGENCETLFRRLILIMREPARRLRNHRISAKYPIM